MGHIGIKSLCSAVDGLPFDDSSFESCTICAKANIRRLPFPQKASHRATRLLERVHCDICGPLPSSANSYRYFILFICCYSRYIFLYLSKTRNKASDYFALFRSTAETFSGKRVKILRVIMPLNLSKGNSHPTAKLQELYMKRQFLTLPHKTASPNAVTLFSHL